jgi:hypothetical protein
VKEAGNADNFIINFGDVLVEWQEKAGRLKGNLSKFEEERQFPCLLSSFRTVMISGSNMNMAVLIS